MASIGWGFIIMGGLALYFRYLVMADKDYHYRLTSEGLIAIYQDSIPNIAYKIVRGLAWLGVLREFNFEVRHSPMPPDGTLRIP
ncbi:hypothetical protein WP2W18C05_10520 [Aeromonas sp. WP2-W18-CRE-05]|nr:hypothetical protein WP2W18C05_10520 [Aeromonas sp. WP2-W18-CRE-05]